MTDKAKHLKLDRTKQQANKVTKMTKIEPRQPPNNPKQLKLNHINQKTTINQGPAIKDRQGS